MLKRLIFNNKNVEHKIIYTITSCIQISLYNQYYSNAMVEIMI